MYAHILFRGSKHEKFLAIFKNIGKYVMDKPRKRTWKKHVFKDCLPTMKIRAKSVFWKSFYKNNIHPQIQMPPPQ